MSITHVKELLRKAKQVVVSTGAGISVESGITTFRKGPNSLWHNYNPDDVATVDGFQKNPRLVWEFYSMRREQYKDAQPNDGHYALVQLEQIISNFTLVTQNIDDLHNKGGSKNVIELHGNLSNTKCSSCDYTERDVKRTPDNFTCPKCSCNLRPDIIWFKEELRPEVFFKACASITNLQENDIFISIGTSHEVYPAADLVTLANEQKAHIVEVNKRATHLRHYVRNLIILEGCSGEILPQLL